MDGLHTEVEQGRLSQQQLKEHYVKRIEQLHSQTEAYRSVHVHLPVIDVETKFKYGCYIHVYSMNCACAIVHAINH